MQIKNLGQENGLWFQANLETNPPILIVSDPKTQKQEYIFGKLDEKQCFYFNIKKFTIGVVIEINKHKAVFWHKNGKSHREDGPAIVWLDGSEFWYKNGKQHREDGPAVVFPTGSQEWCKNGKLHRENGPARIFASGQKEWYQNGERHREDGPAIIQPDGYKEWWINNIKYSKEAWKLYQIKKKCRLKI